MTSCAAPKRAGARRTDTPGSKRTISRTSVASSSAICCWSMTVTVAGASTTATGARVAVTVMIFSSASALASLAATAGCDRPKARKLQLNASPRCRKFDLINISPFLLLMQMIRICN